ncbi:hypothetical protein B0J13DRAFT_136940 [Dactylonectria estremocensis]|uniref:FAD-binding PCMH-type domain-containing protein n=1 Tax=Dactylonectria estremocensis TaxID=1079267 RepID=A0A9P9E263_9HYPO|nr:hypothetical protein B0J13DRAFT_136940 [Dactylonectria estremocensis]
MKISASSLLLPLVALLAGQAEASKCRCLPGDACWPSKSVWNALNATVDGQLIATVPLGSPCHDPNYDAALCEELQDEWSLPQLHFNSSSSVMQAYFANQSCDPFLAESRPCTLGNYVSYAIKASSSAQVAKAVKFATKYNIRLVVRNTGHDYLGRSTGAGALAIWTHHMKSTKVVQWSDSVYNGPALKVGAGVQGSDGVEAAHAAGLTIVSGECPTVGLAGFTLGGGHSALSTSFGLGADQTLEFEAVTAAGDIVTASASKNSDLYWALSGGGAGNFAVVTSITVRAHYTGNIGGATMVVSAAGTNKTTFDTAVERFHDLLPAMIDLGPTVIYYVTSGVLVVKPITLVNSTGDYVKEKVLGPYLDVLASLGVTPTVSFTTLNYRDHYDTYMGPLPFGHIGASLYQYGGRLIPRSVIEDDNASFQKVIRNLTANGVIAVGSSGTFKRYDGVSNAVYPSWRTAIMSMQLATSWDPTRWDDMLAMQKRITNEFVPQISAVTPGAGAYMNEADFNQPNWKETFYGANWDRLLKIKNKWDPNALLYNLKGVGSEVWNVAADGRMCKA